MSDRKEPMTVAELILILLEYDGNDEVVLVGDDDDGTTRIYRPELVWNNTTQVILRGKLKNGGTWRGRDGSLGNRTTKASSSTTKKRKKT